MNTLIDKFKNCDTINYRIDDFDDQIIIYFYTDTCVAGLSDAAYHTKTQKFYLNCFSIGGRFHTSFEEEQEFIEYMEEEYNITIYIIL